MKSYRIIGNEGRITIPYEMRQAIGFRPGDVVSFQVMEEDTVLVKKERLASPERDEKQTWFPDTERKLLSFWEGLSEAQQYKALVNLSVLWAEGHPTKPPGRDAG